VLSIPGMNAGASRTISDEAIKKFAREDLWLGISIAKRLPNLK
jgi:hypothetical protein